MNFVVVFLEGILSFMSPCVLPVLPVYLTILASSSVESLEKGDDSLRKGVLAKNTVLFMLGVSTAFFLIGTSFTALRQFMFQNKQLVLLIGGLFIIFMGLFYMGYLQIPFLQKERKIHLEVHEMKPWTAYVLGFTFSFGWTPCIGPMLASVLALAASSDTALMGNLLIAVYSIGFMIPFMLIALFYKWTFKFLDKLKMHMGTIQKVGGIILIVSGVIMVLGGADNVRGTIKNMFQPKTVSEKQESKPEVVPELKDSESELSQGEESNNREESSIIAPDFSLYDQYGNKHTLSEYKGKTVFLNFWATWCPPCRAEMPTIEQIYEEYGSNKEDVIILGVASPNVGREGSKEDIVKYLEDNKITFPVVLDESENAEVSYNYYINAFPTTFIINKEGNVAQYIPGAMDYDGMKQGIEMER
ncbi:MAG: cytochrome c biogenesis protein CcdA [Cellulosilyticaceae bacterium]